MNVYPDETCLEASKEMLSEEKWLYVIFKIDDSKHAVTVDDKGKTHADLVDTLTKTERQNHCRYVTYNLPLEEDGTTVKHIIYFNWFPNGAHPGEKMLYTSSTEQLRMELIGIRASFQFDNEKELTETNLENELRREISTFHG